MSKNNDLNSCDSSQGSTCVRTRILDAAEELFAEDGLNGVSVRDITARAEVNLGAINYYFGSKEKLIGEVFERRLVPLNCERFAALDALHAVPARLTVESVLEAVFRPTLITPAGSGGGSRAFTILFGRSIAERRPCVDALLKVHFDPLREELTNTLHQILPEVTKVQIFWRLTFAFGALHRWLLLSDTWIPSAARKVNQERQLKMLIAFAAAGLRDSRN